MNTRFMAYQYGVIPVVKNAVSFITNIGTTHKNTTLCYLDEIYNDLLINIYKRDIPTHYVFINTFKRMRDRYQPNYMNYIYGSTIYDLYLHIEYIKNGYYFDIFKFQIYCDDEKKNYIFSCERQKKQIIVSLKFREVELFNVYNYTDGSFMEGRTPIERICYG